MVLGDHIKKGKKLIPPMLADGMPPFVETNWRMERLPELFWLAFLVKRLGERAVLQTTYDMARDVHATVARLRGDNKVVRAYMCSEHLGVSGDERQAIVNEYQSAGWYTTLQPHLRDLAAIWADFPVKYLARDPTGANSSGMVQEVKDVLAGCSHRHAPIALMVQAIAVATEFRAGFMFLTKDIEPPDFNSLADYPDSEESQRAASFAVATFGVIVMSRRDRSNPDDFRWQHQFWNTTYRLQECEYG